MKLYSYWRSSAAFRVRIALNLKRIPFEYVAVNIAPGVNEQLSDAYLETNPEGRVPALETERGTLVQSMAILEWLDETQSGPSFLPDDALLRGKCRAFANTIACDIHPLNNLSVLGMLGDMFGADNAAKNAWYHNWIVRGFRPLEKLASAPRKTQYLYADVPGLAEILLIPQIWNARRFDVDMAPFPALAAMEAKCYKLSAFEHAKPENQPDAP